MQFPSKSSVGRRFMTSETTDFIDSESPNRRDPIRWLVGCGILLIATIAVGTTLMISNFRERALRSSERELENTVLLLARHFDQQLEDVEVPLNDLIREIRIAGIASPIGFKRETSTPEMHMLLKAKVSEPFGIAGINVYDAEGTLINSSEVSVVPAVNIADRAYFKALKSSPELTAHQIEFVRSRFSGGLRTVIARNVIGPNGEFLGIISRAIAPAKFETFFSSVELGKDAAISLVHHDGTLLARYPHTESMIGQKLKTALRFQSQMSDADHETSRIISPIDGLDRLISVYRLSHFPITVVATTTVESALADWREQTKLLVIAAGLSALVIAVTLFLIVRQLSRQHRSSQQRLALEKQRLDTAVDNMTQGLTLFDQSERLVVCNQRYIEMYGLSPDVVKPGCSFRDLIAHRNNVASLQGDVDEHCSRILEHVALGENIIISDPDGRSIQITHRLLSNGGWVATHEDITERIRHEKDVFQQAIELARINMRFDSALNNMTQGLCLFDADKRLVIANSRFREMYDLPEELVMPGTPLPLILQHHADRGAKSDLTVDEHVQTIPTKYFQNFVPADGREISIKRTPTPDGGWVATHEDVTAQRLQEKLVVEKAAELELTNARFDAALRNMSQGISMYDGQKRLVVWNDRFADIYRLPPTLLKVGTHLNIVAEDLVARGILKGETTRSGIENKMASMEQLPINSSRVEELADGRLILISRQPTADGGWVATHEDITERRRAEAEIVHLARHDVLTGLANRAEFNAKLEEATKRLKRNGGAVTLMVLDLDKFKAVNDTLGHPAGDQLLVEVARRLKSSVRETDVLARLGGDEFAIIQDGGPNQHEGAIALALRIINAITQSFDLNGQQASVGTSIGIALAPEHGAEPEELLKRADLALYNVKANGRNDFRVFQDEMLEVAHIQQSAESELRDAISREEFELHYQPVIDVKSRQLCGVEALVRWRHPAKGLIVPDQFIPLAESTGLIVQLGEWVLQRACTDAASWPAHIKVAINTSAVQFRKGNLFDVILCTLVETGLSPERLELEITETALLENREAHLATIRQLKNLGISMALDDFGTGYSSVNYLTIFPFDKIKIDKSFTQGVLSRRDCKAVVASTLALAHGLGTVTTAEGVESEEQLEYMRKAGVDLVQGYLFGRPVPISEFGQQATKLTELVA